MFFKVVLPIKLHFKFIVKHIFFTKISIVFVKKDRKLIVKFDISKIKYLNANKLFGFCLRYN